jgi:hypothetical protein
MHVNSPLRTPFLFLSFFFLRHGPTVTQADLALAILLLQSPESWDYGCPPSLSLSPSLFPLPLPLPPPLFLPLLPRFFLLPLFASFLNSDC